MQILKILLAVAAFSILPVIGHSAEEHGVTLNPGTAHEAAGAHEQHGLPLYAVPLKDFGFFKLTNSMLVTWIVALGLIVFAQMATRNIKRVPEGAQNFWEWLVEGLYKFLEDIIGHDLVRKTFW